jgi:hypothetical protein
MTRFRSNYTARPHFNSSEHRTSTNDRTVAQGNLAAFTAARPEVAAWIVRNAQASNAFAANCLQGIHRYGSPTANMIAAVERAIEREAAPQQPASPSYIRPMADRIMLPGIVAAFQSAQASGEVRRPTLRVVIDGAEVTLQLAAPTSANPGHIYVKNNGEYVGKITPAGAFIPSREAPALMGTALQSIDANPMAAARAYAKFTAERDGNVGSCCCCGRLLTNPESVRLGIGPICGGRWGWL